MLWNQDSSSGIFSVEWNAFPFTSAGSILCISYVQQLSEQLSELRSVKENKSDGILWADQNKELLSD